MATWLTHLRIAASIKERVKAIDLGYLMMGSIAPDSGEPDEDVLKYIPSKDITHNVYVRPDNSKDIDDRAFFSKYLEPEKIFARSDKTRSFLWGYYFHLLTDKLWLEQHFRMYYDSYRQGADAGEKEAVDFIREEMYSLDFEYLKQHGNELINIFEQSNANVDFFSEFDVEYIYRNKNRILDFYKGQPVVLQRPDRFLSAEAVDGFISKASESCVNILIYGA